MEYTKLGNSELNVSRICMGCMGFGTPKAGQHSWTLDEEHSREIIKHGLELGVNFFDTAVVYQGGTSEQFVGRALRDFWIKACVISVWITWTFIFIICGITIRRSMILWKALIVRLNQEK